jgi:hypothetical protein
VICNRSSFYGFSLSITFTSQRFSFVSSERFKEEEYFF